MKRIIIISSIILLTVVSYSFLDSSEKITPHISFEGDTTDHSIIYNYRGDYEHHWTLRFPSTYQLTKNGTPELYSAPQTTFDRSAYLWFQMPEMKIHLKKNNKMSDDLVKVKLYADPFIYKLKWWQSKSASETEFIKWYEAYNGSSCYRDKEVNGGVFILRSETEEEAKIFSKNNNIPYLGASGCVSHGILDDTGIRKVIIYDLEKNPIGLGQCGDINDEQSICTVSFWISINRIISYKLKKLHLSNIKNIHEKISNKIVEATVSIRKVKKN